MDTNPEAQPPRDQTEYIGRWCEAIDAARTDEKDWLKQARDAVALFRGDKDSKATAFNIYHSNIELMVPTVYSSQPVPDIRRRFSDDDPVGRVVADLLERALSYSMDEYDIDARAVLAVYDMLNPGRGMLRVRYVPTVEMDPALGVERVTGQAVECEYVPFDRFVRGPGITWDDTPWHAFEHYLDRIEVAKLVGEERAGVIPYLHSAYGDADKRKSTDETPEEFKRAKVYEIWDKRTKRVTFICPDHKAEVLKEEDDPLGLKEFFPFPRPMQAIASHGSQVPICPLNIYSELIAQLNEISKRITRLVKQLRPRGGYIGAGLDVKAMIEAEDGELVPLQGTEQMLTTGGANLNNLLTWFPMEPTVLAIRELMAQREVVKQNIYEVTGIADIMRGATDPRETMGAQQIKAQFGSIRVRSRQAEVARFMRDIVRLKAEIIAKFFEPEQLMAMTGIKLLPEQQKAMAMQMAQQNPEQAQQIAAQQPELAQAVQAPSIEEVMQLLRSPLMRGYRIDIETDSTIRGDMMRNQEQMTGFLQGTAQFMSAIGPAVQNGAVPQDVAVEIYAAFARAFQLGKSAEDAIERMGKASQQGQQEGGPQAQQQQADQAKAQADQQKAQMQAQVEQAKLQLESSRQANEQQMKERELALRQYEIELQDKRERDKTVQELNSKQAEAAMNVQLKREQAQASAKPTTAISLDANGAMGQLAGVLTEALNRQDDKISSTLSGLAPVLQSLSAPRRVIRDPQTGRAIGSEIITQ